GPFALALPDGSVLLTPDGLEVCYKQVAPQAGDSRLAFVLGHELSHLARDDFWHAFTAAAAARQPAAEAVRIPPETTAEARMKELEADSFGVVYMTMAGYQPSAIVGEGTSFLDEWTARLPAGALAGRGHPSARERTALVRTALRSVADQLDFFRFGVRLYA